MMTCQNIKREEWKGMQTRVQLDLSFLTKKERDTNKNCITKTNRKLT